MSYYFEPAGNFSKISIISIACVILSIFCLDGLLVKDRISLDAAIYYAYLPAIVINGDARLLFLDKEDNAYKNRIWYQAAPNGGKVLKYTMGISILLSPFFIAAHFLSELFGENQDGYSLVYQNALSFGVLSYFFLGLICLRKFLLTCFSDVAVAVTLVSVSIGTNLLWYITYDGLWAHGLLFSMFCISIYSHHLWIKKRSINYFLLFILSFGFAILSRPTSAIWSLYFLIATYVFENDKVSLTLFLRKYLKFMVTGLCIVVILCIPQLVYWKFVTDQWVFDSYTGEPFLFGKPMIGEFLLGFRKGWFVYTPVMLLATFGFVKPGINKIYSLALIIPICISTYVLSSWWCWSYGIAWGMRPMIDFYGFMAIPMTALYSAFLDKPRIVRTGLFTIVILLIGFNLFQTWQYKNGLIHFDNMTRKAYATGLFQVRPSPEWYRTLEPYDYDDRLYTSPSLTGPDRFFSELSETEKVIFKSQDSKYMTDYENYLTGFGTNSRGALEFYIIRIAEDTVVFKTIDDRYWATDRVTEEVYFSRTDFSNAERFILKQVNNQDISGLAILACNGKYLMLTETTGYILASSGIISNKSVFRLYKKVE